MDLMSDEQWQKTHVYESGWQDIKNIAVSYSVSIFVYFLVLLDTNGEGRGSRWMWNTREIREECNLHAV